MNSSELLHGFEILLVENKPGRREFSIALSADGARVTLECSGESAADLIRRLTRRGGRFDAVILDLGPFTVEATTAIRRAGHRGMLAAVMTRSGLEEAWRAAGGDLILSKAHARSEFVAAITTRRTAAG